MSLKPKIKIDDDATVRKQILAAFENTTQICASKWAMTLAEEMLLKADFDSEIMAEVKRQIDVAEKWQQGNASVPKVRKAAFAVNDIARACQNPLNMACLSAVVHAIATGHVKDHAMVSSDYYMRAINYLYPSNGDMVTKMREHQLALINKIILEEKDKQ